MENVIDKALFQLPKVKKIFLSLAGIYLLQAFSIIGQAYFLADAIVYLWQGKGLSWTILAFFLSFATRHLLVLIRERLLDRYAYEQAKSTRKQLLRKIFSLGPSLVQKEGTGNIVTMALEGISDMESYIRLVLSKLLSMAILPLLFLLVVFSMDRLSGFVLLIVFPIVILFMLVLGYAARKKAEDQFQNFQLLSNHFIDSLRGLETLRLFGLSKSYANAIYQTSEQFRKSTMSTLRVAILSTFALDFFTTLSTAIVAVFLGLRLMDGAIEFFPALVILILTPEYFLPLRDFAGDYHATLNGKNAMTAIENILRAPEVKEKDRLAIKCWNEKSEIVLKDVRFSYEESQTSLAIDFSWKGFGKIGIIGASGSGKTTMIQLLSGFLQADQGEIFINQEKIPHFAQEKWQRQVNFIPQNTYLFHASVRENICLYTPNATDEEVQKAIKASGLSDFLEKLPHGLATVIGEGARQLSGGQAQRVALARAFLSDERKILLLDEPTAHLDIETENDLKENLLPLLENKLVFLATHRLHWMPQMDCILVIEHGKIVTCGTHENLLKESTVYQQLINEMRGVTR